VANKARPVYVTYYGILLRMSERKYRELLRTAALGERFDVADFGKVVSQDVQEVTYLPANRAAKTYHARYGCFPTLESCRDAKLD
jgi:predicted mannosyl-3-phosphoglycerate phosphatase (HAD superfamily)